MLSDRPKAGRTRRGVDNSRRDSMKSDCGIVELIRKLFPTLTNQDLFGLIGEFECLGRPLQGHLQFLKK